MIITDLSADVNRVGCIDAYVGDTPLPQCFLPWVRETLLLEATHRPIKLNNRKKTSENTFIAHASAIHL